MVMLSDDDAKTIKRLEEAAREHGEVMNLLSAIEEWQTSGQPASIDVHLFELAAMAAPFARLARVNDGTDQQE